MKRTSSTEYWWFKRGQITEALHIENGALRTHRNEVELVQESKLLFRLV